MSKGSPEAYQTLANIIYAEKPHHKEALQEAARAIVASTKEAMPGITDDELEIVFQMLAQVTAGFLSSAAVDLSDRMNAAFNVYSLCAGSVTGALDLGDATPAKDMDTLRKEAQEAAQARAEAATDGTGLYL